MSLYTRSSLSPARAGPHSTPAYPLLLLAAGIVAVQTTEGQPVTEGQVQTDKLRPARRGGRPIAVVEWAGDHWLPLKLD